MLPIIYSPVTITAFELMMVVVSAVQGRSSGHHSNFVKLLSSTQLFGLANRKTKENNFLHATTSETGLSNPRLELLFLLIEVSKCILVFVM